MKFRFLLSTLFIVAVLFSSCDKDDDGISVSKDELIGKWALVSATYTVNGVTESETDLNETITFNEDDTYSMSYDGFLEEEGQYSISGNKLTLTIGEGDEMEQGVMTITHFSDNSFTISASESEEFMGETFSVSFTSEYERVID
ncbi:lipocalin family protein [Carboxylicivirga sp. M1479]|uniref:lipocalin family protein n=1 Tax=Carboxylicivirga sp. M1479 TaxID=2594476 RepID=UPI001177C61A|nr:lipocalin family protein [Carboxylicivirga sp. M1479]TRX64590.1 lipocalin family protein [Carboxylicivirga sp. M1479]